MGKTFEIPIKPYDTHKVYKHSTIEIEPGITILIGCNGSGKSTILNFIERSLNAENIDYISYDNLYEGGNSARQASLESGDIELLATLACSSEGEQISLNLGTVARRIGGLVRRSTSGEVWLLFDAIDSGLSIDQVQEVKDLFHLIVEDANNKDIYIVCSANEYEMCADEKCFNVVEGKYIKINDYLEYKKEILKTRAYKDKMINNYYKNKKKE